MEKRRSFIFYRSYRESLRSLSRRNQGALLLAIIDYALDEIEPEGLPKVLQAMFELIRPTIDTAHRNQRNGRYGGSQGITSNNPNGRRGKPDMEYTEEQKQEAAILEFIRVFNTKLKKDHSNIKPVQVLNGTRRACISAILKLYKREQWEKAITNIAVSDFANGRGSGRTHPADFDWIIQAERFAQFYENSL